MLYLQSITLLPKEKYVLLNRAGDNKVVETIKVRSLYNVHFKEHSIKTKLYTITVYITSNPTAI